MSNSAQASNDPRVTALREQFGARQRKFFLTFGVGEMIVLGLTVLALYVFEIVEPDLRVPILVIVVLLCGSVMAFGIMSMTRNYQRDLRDITGG